MQAQASRLAKELRQLASDPPPGAWAAPRADSLTELEGQLQGPVDTVYEGGLFKLAINIPARYPFEPPKVKFITPVYHPNVDREGRICLDILNMPPKGSWKPSLNLSTVLASIGLLLADPNPDDGLVAEITAEFRHQRQVFDAKARQLTRHHTALGAAGEAVGCDEMPAAGSEALPASAAVTQEQQEEGRQQQQPVPAAATAPAQVHGDENQGAAANQPVAGQGVGEGGPAAKRSRLALRK